ncbi:MAG: ABC transporter permease [Chloroflexota bacterium]
MAVANPTFEGQQPSEGLSFRVTRIGVFSIFFLIVGAMLTFWVPAAIGGDIITGVGLGENMRNLLNTTERVVIPVPTVPYSLIVGVLYLATGIIGLWPLPMVPEGAHSNYTRLRSTLLIVSGVLVIPTVLIVAAADNTFNMVVLLQVSLRLATPIILGSLAGIWTERSGVVNIAIEGMMLTGAGVGFVVYTLMLGLTIPTGTQLFLAVLVAILAGGVMSLLHAWLSITFKTDQIVSGTVINIMAVGITSFLRREVLLSNEAGRQTLPVIDIPLLKDIPILGEVFFQGKPIFYLMLILVVVTHVVMFYTQWGLRTRSVGENPHAADTLGIPVNRTRWINVFIGGLIAGLAGAWFSLETTGSFDDNMTNGKGFIALAAMIFGKWMPFGAAGGGLLFGFSESLGDRFQTLGVPVPHQLVQMTPYIITLVVLAGLVGRAIPPKAIGQPYEKE